MVQVNINLRTVVKGFCCEKKICALALMYSPLGARKNSYLIECFRRLHASLVPVVSLSVPHLFQSFIITHTPTSVLRQEHITGWPLQVTDGNLTALLTVNWVLIKPKHMWEMLIIHCRLEESNLENTVTMHVHRWFIITFPWCDKITIIGIADEKREAGWTVWCIPGCKDPGAPSLSKINMDKDSANSDPAVLKQTLAKLSKGSSSCLYAMKK